MTAGLLLAGDLLAGNGPRLLPSDVGPAAWPGTQPGTGRRPAAWDGGSGRR